VVVRPRVGGSFSGFLSLRKAIGEGGRLTGEGRHAGSSVDDGDVPLADTGVTADGTRAQVGTAVTCTDRRQCRRQRRMLLLTLLAVIVADVTTSADRSPTFIQQTYLGRLARRLGARIYSRQL